MASEFAKSLASRLPDATFIGRTALKDYVPRQRMIDAELQEVREVLCLTWQRIVPDGKPCWCEEYMQTLPHEEDCLRARALYQRLLIPKGE